MDSTDQSPHEELAMSTEESKAVVRTMVEKSMTLGDVDAAVACYAPDFVYHNPVLEEMPGLPTGPDAVRVLVAGARAAFPDMRYTIEALIGEGDMVAVLYS
jgi:ketosteroid isomerase-like protein